MKSPVQSRKHHLQQMVPSFKTVFKRFWKSKELPYFSILGNKKCKNFEGCSLYTANVAQHIEHAKVNFR